MYHDLISCRFVTVFLTLLIALEAKGLGQTTSPKTPLPEDTDLGEATGLAPVNDAKKATIATPAPEERSWSPLRGLSGRGSLIFQGRYIRKPKETEAHLSGPLIEMGLASDYKPTEKIAVFGEGRLFYDHDLLGHRNQGFLDQGGIRLRPVDQMLFVIGKERNRRSPGLLLSPSDFLHSSQSPPGLREDRSGVWQVRTSLQLENHSIDAIHLPIADVGLNGMPAKGGGGGNALRYFGRFPTGIDLGLEMARLKGDLLGGAFTQVMIAQVYKVYLEVGVDREKAANSYLLGTSYEGLADTLVRFEYYESEAGWSQKSPFFQDHKYAIVSLSLAEIKNEFNLTDTLVKSLETEDLVHVLRGEWIFSSWQTAGLSTTHIVRDQGYQWQALGDWKLSF